MNKRREVLRDEVLRVQDLSDKYSNNMTNFPDYYKGTDMKSVCFAEGYRYASGYKQIILTIKSKIKYYENVKDDKNLEIFKDILNSLEKIKDLII